MDGNDAAVVQHSDLVAQPHDLGEFCRDQKNGCALITLLDDLVVDVFNRGNIDAPRGLAGNQQIWLIVDLACNDDFLDIAAGHGTDRGLFAGSFDVIFLDQFLCKLPNPIPAQQCAEPELPALVETDQQVLCDGLAEAGAAQIAVVRDIADALLAKFCGRDTGDIFAVIVDLAAAGLQETGQRINQFSLSVALHARDPKDLALVNGKRNVFNFQRVFLIAHAQTPNFEDRFIGMGLLRALQLGIELAPNHQFGDLLRRCLRSFQRPNGPTTAQDRNMVGDLHDLANLMRDQNDRIAVVDQ